MKRALLPLWFIGGIVCTTTVANAQSLEPASIRSDQAEIHSVVVDVPRVHIAAACVSGSLGGVVGYRTVDPLNGQLLTNEQVAQNRLHASTW